jgi:hypothetical protein
MNTPVFNRADQFLALKLREAALTLRRTPMPLSVFIPLIQEAADRLDSREVTIAKAADPWYSDAPS